MRKMELNFSKTNDLLEGNVSVFLDLIRGISAVLVVMEHLSSRLFVGYGNVENQNVLSKILYLLNILGGPSVIIFFVLSGLFISRSVLKAVYESKWSWQSYLINRLSRLLVVLVPALILTFILDIIAVNSFGYEGYTNIFDNLSAFIGNLFFLQNIFVGVYGSNAPLWSLNYEFWYYMLFPVLLLLFFTKQKKVFKLIYALIAVLIFSTVGMRMNSYFLIWLVGTFILVLPRVNFLKKGFIPVLALIILFVAMIIRPLVMTGRLFTDKWTENLFGVDLFVGIAFGLFIYTLLHIVAEKIRFIEFNVLSKISKLIAGFSFSLYLIHYPIINTVYYWAEKNGFSGMQPSLISVALEGALILLVCIIAYYFSRMTEAQTNVVRKFINMKTNTLMVNRRRFKEVRKQKAVG
ncbi:acyltransferase family protein [Rossellomorea vietnamensis]|uniref:Acyltransferase family protein n=1 Tax=Rossellomorea vietnamensis TaxID=218284 RepID=A0A6I6ULH4_9BACI|nr:acyltransferase [Rossellomorea vietnamensis]QHE59821.1 acyltransferase family protein [Rossellomorea vietnamensis]